MKAVQTLTFSLMRRVFCFISILVSVLFTRFFLDLTFQRTLFMFNRVPIRSFIALH